MSRSLEYSARIAGRRPCRRACVLVVVIASVSTAALSRQRGVLEGLELRKRSAEQMRLPGALREISGLAVTPDGRVFAHGDERAIVSEVDYRRGAIVKSFALGSPILAGDFEGLAIADKRFFLITSTGRLY